MYRKERLNFFKIIQANIKNSSADQIVKNLFQKKKKKVIKINKKRVKKKTKKIIIKKIIKYAIKKTNKKI